MKPGGEDNDNRGPLSQMRSTYLYAFSVVEHYAAAANVYLYLCVHAERDDYEYHYHYEHN